MKPILVPAPPRSAYNENRRVSDLLLSQLKHFQHIERKRGDLGIAPAIARNIYTEGGAALYITAVTRALRGVPTPQPAAVATVAAPSQPPKVVPGVPLAAAAATISAPPAKSASKKRAPRRAPAKKTTRKK